MTRLLVITAVEAERAAIVSALAGGSAGRAQVIVGGVGPAAAAAAASAALASGRFELAISAGIGGGFAPLGLEQLAVASSIVFADLGAETDAGFVPVPALGFGRDTYDVDPQLAIELADRCGGHLGTILTVATVTGTAATAADRSRMHPDAVAEGMEGAGVAAAAAHHGIRFAEIRAISNLVGPRDRAAWCIPQALAALGQALAGVAGGWSA